MTVAVSGPLPCASLGLTPLAPSTGGSALPWPPTVLAQWWGEGGPCRSRAPPHSALLLGAASGARVLQGDAGLGLPSSVASHHRASESSSPRHSGQVAAGGMRKGRGDAGGRACQSRSGVPTQAWQSTTGGQQGGEASGDLGEGRAAALRGCPKGSGASPSQALAHDVPGHSGQWVRVACRPLWGSWLLASSSWHWPLCITQSLSTEPRGQIVARNPGKQDLQRLQPQRAPEMHRESVGCPWEEPWLLRDDSQGGLAPPSHLELSPASQTRGSPNRISKTQMESFKLTHHARGCPASLPGGLRQLRGTVPS